MAATSSGILQDIVSTLRSSGEFALVTLGRTDDQAQVPRAHVLYEGQDTFQSDDTPDSRWGRLRARVIVHTRCGSAAEGLGRANDLCDSAGRSLLDDAFRGQRCRDLPIGCATEIGAIEVVAGIKRPEVEISLDVRCHFEIEDET